MKKLKLNKFKIILLLIVVLGMLLRVFWQQISPPGFNADEAALGYNAYSILKNGKDEWGEKLPLVFKSFSDYKPGLYVYLDIPFVAVFGLNELSTRMPSIILGTLTILVIYLLTWEITKKETTSLAAAFLLAISPWAIHFSRGAWETNVATFFISLGVLCFIKGIGGSVWWWVGAALAFIASMYTYQSPRVIVPCLLLGLAILYFKKISLRKIIPPLIIATVLLVPLVFIVFSNKGLARFQGVSIFTDIGPKVRMDEARGQHPNTNSNIARLYHNTLLAYSLNFLDHYSDHFTPNFLFSEGDPLGRNKVSEFGQMYLFEMLSLLLGIFYLIKYKNKNSRILLLWILAAPVAASLTYQTPHALRAENMVVPLTSVSGIGLGFLIERLSSLKMGISYLAYGVVVLVIGFFFVKFLHQYFVHLPKEYALEWEYGFSKLVPMVEKYQGNYQKVVITDRYDQPYILFLFYSKYDPLLYQKSAKPTGVDKFGFSTIRSYNNYEFRSFTPEEVVDTKGVLFVGTAKQIPDGYPLVDEINFPNGKPAFELAGKVK